MQFHIRSILILSALLWFTGCTLHEALEPPTATSFIQAPELLEKPKQTPFSLAWMAPGMKNNEYNRIVVAAVRSNEANPENWIYSSSALLRSKESYLDLVNELAEYIQKEVTKEFEEYPRKPISTEITSGIAFEPAVQNLPIQIPDERNPSLENPTDGSEGTPAVTDILHERTLEVRISIAQVDFGDPILYGGLFAVPIPAAANLSTAARSPSMTLEARLVDSETQQAVAELVDRRFPRIKALDLNRLTVVSAVHEMADSFAADLVASFYRKKGQKVRRRFPVTLIPW